MYPTHSSGLVHRVPPLAER